MKVLSVRLNDQEAVELKTLCERTGLTPSRAVKQGLAELAGRAPGNKSLGQLAREMGVAGSFSGPPDLAERHGHYFGRALRGGRAKGHR